MNQIAKYRFDAYRWMCLLVILVVGMVTPSLILFSLEVTLGDISPIESLTDIARQQFEEGKNLFLLAVFGLIPFCVLAVILRILSSRLARLQFSIFAFCGLVGILALMIPAHVSVWRPLYTDEPTSSTAVITFLFIPFYCIMSMGVGMVVASLISIFLGIKKKNQPDS